MLDDTFGATLIGLALATFTHGIVTVQVFRYWITYRDDSRFTRLYVLLLWLLNTVLVISICHLQYYYTVTNYGNFEALTRTTWSYSLALCLTAVMTFMVQFFLARRTWNFARRSRSTQIPRTVIHAFGAVTAIVSLAQLVIGLVATYTTWKVRYFAKLKGVENQWILVSWLSSAAFCDVLLVFSLTTVLVNQRTGFKRTDMLIYRIILFTVNTGLLTSVVAVVDLILFCSMPQNFIHFTPHFTIGTLYVFALLTTLHTVESSRSTSSDGAHSGLASRSSGKQNVPGVIPFTHGTGGGTRDPATSGTWLPEAIRVQVCREVCIQDFRTHDGASQLSRDQDDAKGYDSTAV